MLQIWMDTLIVHSIDIRWISGIVLYRLTLPRDEQPAMRVFSESIFDYVAMKAVSRLPP
jgi:hypothetical protein